jgi:hypothetical protein
MLHRRLHALVHHLVILRGVNDTVNSWHLIFVSKDGRKLFVSIIHRDFSKDKLHCLVLS